MNARYLASCERSHRAIVRQWTAMLRMEPGWRDLDSTPYFTDLMERILDQLWAMLRTPASTPGPAEPDVVALPRWEPSHCGLTMVLPFLDTGKRALEEVIEAADREPARATADQRARLRWQLMLAFEAIAQRGIEQVCGGCSLGRSCVWSGCPEAERVSPATGPVFSRTVLPGLTSVLPARGR